MKLFKKDTTETLTGLPKSRAQQRAAKLDNSSLCVWMDNTIMQLGTTFDSWRYHDAPSSEVADCIEALAVIWEELDKRKTT